MPSSALPTPASALPDSFFDRDAQVLARELLDVLEASESVRHTGLRYCAIPVGSVKDVVGMIVDGSVQIHVYTNIDFPGLDA